MIGTRRLVLACLAVASVSFAGSITVALEDFQASGVLGYRYNNSETLYGSSGLYRLRTSNPVGSGAALGDPLFAFCMEAMQPYTSAAVTYQVGDVTSAHSPPNPFTGPITQAQGDLVAQLFALHFDSTWEDVGPYSPSQITGAMAMHSAILEIVSDFDGSSLSSLDLDAGLFILVSGHILDINDPAQALPIKAKTQEYLNSLSLSYTGPLAPLVALTNPEFQDYVAVVPEPATVVLYVIGAVALVVADTVRRRKRVA